MADPRKTAALAFAGVAMATPAWAQSAAEQSDSSTLGVVLLIALAVGIYMLPTILASSRHHPSRWAILVINVVFGATLLGWLGSLIWALHWVHRPDDGSQGGESGLNLFVNDEQQVRIVNPGPITVETDPVDQLTKLKTLFDAGAVSQEEYDTMRKRILARLA